MIGYVTIGTNDFDRGVAFYDALFAVLDVKRLWRHGNQAAWGPSRSEASVLLTAPFDGAPATAGNGQMIALRAPSRELVDKVHQTAIALGATDEGAPGPRGDHGFYGAYFRDLDGNKLNAYLPAS